MLHTGGGICKYVCREGERAEGKDEKDSEWVNLSFKTERSRRRKDVQKARMRRAGGGC